MRRNTHEAIDPSLCGTPRELEAGRAVVELETREAMAADGRGLVHGGFVFGMADYAAMLAVNHPNVVLGSAEVRFTAPVAVGEVLIARAQAAPAEGKKLPVDVEVSRGGGDKVFQGRFVCFTPSRHVLDREQQG